MRALSPGILICFILWGVSILSLHIEKPKVSPLWSGPRLTRSRKRNAKLWFLLGLIGIESSLEIYARLPQELIYGSTPVVISKTVLENSPNLVLLFPGAGGPDENTNMLRDKIIKSDNEKKIDRKVIVYDWLQWRGSFVRAAFDSQIVGKTICSDLAKDSNLENVHVIGVSVGAFAADSCAKVLKSETVTSPNPLKVRLTFLDPFTSKGIFGYAWGVENFGKSINYVESYLNSDDEVPTTNDPLQKALNYDVTQSKLRESFHPYIGDSMHAWPVAYLAKVWHTDVDNQGKLTIADNDVREKGSVTQIQ